MANEGPGWRRAFDAVEAVVAPQIDGLVRSEQFQIAAGLVASARREAQRRAEQSMRRTLHLWNLPAGSDVTRILNELGKLQREVRELSRRLDEQGEEGSDGSNGRRSTGSPRTRSPRR